MSNLEPIFTSRSEEWETPQELFDALDAEFHFDLDVCASDANHKCERYFTKEQDGLAQTWAGTCWMNPPYGSAIGKWMERALRAAEGPEEATVVALVPARTDTKWWHNWAIYASEVRFFKGRINFVGGESGSTFPSVLLIFRPYSVPWCTKWSRGVRVRGLVK